MADRKRTILEAKKLITHHLLNHSPWENMITGVGIANNMIRIYTRLTGEVSISLLKEMSELIDGEYEIEIVREIQASIT